MLEGLLRRRLAVLATVLLGLACAGPVHASGPAIALTLTASTKVAAVHTEVTFHATATVSGGPLTNVWLVLSYTAQSCEPVDVCSIDPGHVNWKFPTLNGTTDLYATTVSATSLTYRIDVDACTPNCLATSASVRIGAPTLSASVTRSPSGPVMPGDTVQFTVTGATNVGPVPADVQTNIVSGLSAPTTVPSGGTWYPSSMVLSYPTTLDLKTTYSFDAVVTGAVGGQISFDVDVRPDDIRDGGSYPGGFYKKTFTFAIGPTPTKTPFATRTPAPSRTPGGTAAPVPTVRATANTTASPLGSVGATVEPAASPSSAPASVSATTRISAPGTAPAGGEASTSPDPGGEGPSTASAPLATGPLALVSVLVVAGGVIVVLASRRGRAR